MAGPTLSVLLKGLTTTNIQKLYTLINELSEKREDKDFYMSSSSVSYGMSEQKPFSFDIIDIDSDESEYDTQELDQIEIKTNFRPNTNILLMAMTNDFESHKLLGILALKIAENFNGIIDFGGKLNIDDSIKGKTYNINYETAVGTSTQYNICDVEFMKYWLEHENFSLKAAKGY